MKRKHKILLKRIILAFVLFLLATVICKLVDLKEWIALILFICPYLIAGYDVLLKAFRNIIKGRVFDENFLMCVATVGALAIKEFPEAVFVMIFYQIGELFQSITVGKSRRSIAALMDIKPNEARVIRDGCEITVDPEELQVGEIIVVRAGEKIATDGVMHEGESELNCMALTGESTPRYVTVGDKVSGGCVNLSGSIKIKVSARYVDSTVSKVLELVENASAVKSKTDRFITRFARYYTPFVVFSAFLLFLIPALITKNASEWLGRALVFLVISCPCALVISVPLSYFGGIGAASKKGILIKGALYLERLADVEKVVFDKTGTLTKGEFEVAEVLCFDEHDELYAVAAAIESLSNHPVAKAIYDYCARSGDSAFKMDVINERAGMGIVGTRKGIKYFAGNSRLLLELGIKTEEINTSGTVVYVGCEARLLGRFIVKDEIKPNSISAIQKLKHSGIKECIMLSGDRSECAIEIANRLMLDKAVSELMPAEKVKELEHILEDTPDGKKVAYVGDGINDAPVISRADIGMSMSALGSDAAIEAADVVLMDDDPCKVADAIRIGKSTKRIVIQNIVFALGMKLLFMLLGAFDIAGLWMAVFADVGVSVISILNSMRALKIK